MPRGKEYKPRSDVTSKVALPKNMRGRPAYRGFVVPYFVAWYRGDKMADERDEGAIPSFPTTDQRRATICRKNSMCWVCGKKMGSFRTFVFGPSSAIVRQSIEPPSHRECAIYAAQVCPFMIGGKSINTKRGENLRSTEVVNEMVATYNPGLAVLWTTKSYDTRAADPTRGIYVYRPDDPVNVQFWHKGHIATRDEVAAAFKGSINASKLYDHMPAAEIGWRVAQLMKWIEGEH